MEEGRKLFAHYLWNAGVVMAEGIERGSGGMGGEGEGARGGGGDRVGGGIGVEEGNEEEEINGAGAGEELWDRSYWDVRGQSVLELGAGRYASPSPLPCDPPSFPHTASHTQSSTLTPTPSNPLGTALPSLLSALSGARTVTITDHPTSPSLTTDAIPRNVRENITCKQQQPTSTTIPSPSPDHVSARPDRDLNTAIEIYGHAWGTSTFYSTESYGTPIPASAFNPLSGEKHTQQFTRILVSDCLWMASQHENLLASIRTFLACRTDDEEDVDEDGKQERVSPVVPCALIVAGFHTGRRIVSAFFDLIGAEDDAHDEDEEGNGDGEGDCKDYGEKDDDGGSQKENENDGASTSIPSAIARKKRLRIASIFELDVFGRRRAWVAHERDGETKDDAKAWCVVAVLAWR